MHCRNDNPNFLPSLQAIEITNVTDDEYAALHHVNQFLGSNLILQWARNNLFVKCVLLVIVCNGFGDDYDLFAAFCGVLYSFVMEKLVPIDISIRFCELTEDGKNRLRKAYSLCLHLNKEKILNKYKPPPLNKNKNKCWQVLKNPIVRLHAYEENQYTIHVANACAVDTKFNNLIDLN